MNGKPIESPLQDLPIYVNQIGEYQEKAYQLIVNAMKQTFQNTAQAFEDLDKFGFRLLQTPLEALDIVYPSPKMDEQIRLGNLEIEPATDQPGDEADEADADEVGVSMPMGWMVGKKGIKSIMNYVSTANKRGNFDYRPEILENYGRIFNLDVLPKYSSKIASICNIILNSTGLIIVYSQYIDGGIVPMALALEEMGFSRYSSSGDMPSLFETPPTEALDAVSMKPKTQMADSAKFRPAKYVMITGDKSLSPHNAEEMKNISSSENKHGELVKVILISKAGSEGLDFKNIRQIHMLEPWYNLNRTEQIVGRGVRNLSHCGLPFDQRNVEIYMHSTILRENPIEEAVDIYIYRLAKKKADQIGRVTRLIKETAVDCILNIGQTNFTIDKLNALAANQNIELTLSTGKQKLKYKVGDRPHTDICDYMDNCAFTCSPNATISSTNIVQDTYSNEFVQMNNPRIMQRIRQLFKEQHFYTRKVLIQSINIVKQYPVEQIYSALTAFIQNKNEFVIDAYGRRGNLVSKGNVYAFQPIEINDTQISVYERSAPIDFKRNILKMDIPTEFSQNKMVEIPSSELKGSSIEEQYKKIMETFDTQYDWFVSTKSIEKGDKNWYKHAGHIADHLQIAHGIQFEQIVDHIIRHMVDYLLPSDKIVLVSHFYSRIIDLDSLSEIETVVKRYLDEKMVIVDKRSGFFLAEEKSWAIYVKQSDLIERELEKGMDPTQWVEAEPEDIRMFEQSGELNRQFKIDPKMYSNTVGFINMFKNGKEMVFRLKNLDQLQNNTGTRVDSLIKGDIIKRLNTILGKQLYNDSDPVTRNILQPGFCAITELILRQRTSAKMDGKQWFLNPEEAIYNEITKYHAKK